MFIYVLFSLSFITLLLRILFCPVSSLKSKAEPWEENVVSFLFSEPEPWEHIQVMLSWIWLHREFILCIVSESQFDIRTPFYFLVFVFLNKNLIVHHVKILNADTGYKSPVVFPSSTTKVDRTHSEWESGRGSRVCTGGACTKGRRKCITLFMT